MSKAIEAKRVYSEEDLAYAKRRAENDRCFLPVNGIKMFSAEEEKIHFASCEQCAAVLASFEGGKIFDLSLCAHIAGPETTGR